jgi:hypothetical protein
MTYKVLKYTLNKKAQRYTSDISNNVWKTLKIPPRLSSAYGAGYNLGATLGSKLKSLDFEPLVEASKLPESDIWKALKPLPPKPLHPTLAKIYRTGYNLGSAVGSKLGLPSSEPLVEASKQTLSKYPRLFDAVKKIINKIPGL